MGEVMSAPPERIPEEIALVIRTRLQGNGARWLHCQNAACSNAFCTVVAPEEPDELKAFEQGCLLAIDDSEGPSADRSGLWSRGDCARWREMSISCPDPDAPYFRYDWPFHPG